jgi:hypothetical protein
MWVVSAHRRRHRRLWYPRAKHRAEVGDVRTDHALARARRTGTRELRLDVSDVARERATFRVSPQPLSA